MKTPDELIEDGVALIAQGLYRANQQNGPREARQLCEAARSTLSGLWMDFAKADKEFIATDPRAHKTA